MTPAPRGQGTPGQKLPERLSFDIDHDIMDTKSGEKLADMASTASTISAALVSRYNSHADLVNFVERVAESVQYQAAHGHLGIESIALDARSLLARIGGGK